MALKVRNRKRVLRSFANGASKKPAIEPPRYSSGVERLMGLTNFYRLVDCLQNGVTAGKIAEWFDREDWTDGMSVATFTQYIYLLKRERPELLEKNHDQSQSYDAFVGSRLPTVDADVELDKLIAIQKRRLSAEIQTELNMGKLFDNTHKEIKVMGELLTMRKGGLTQSSPSSVASDGSALRSMRVSEGQADRMQEHVTNLFKVITDASKKKTAAAQPKGRRPQRVNGSK